MIFLAHQVIGSVAAAAAAEMMLKLKSVLREFYRQQTSSNISNQVRTFNQQSLFNTDRFALDGSPPTTRSVPVHFDHLGKAIGELYQLDISRAWLAN